MSKVRVSSKESRPGRLIAARILPGTDLLAGLSKICHEHKVRAGCIVTMLGGLTGARLLHPVPDASSKMGIKYGEPSDLEGPLEFASGSGTIGVLESGETVIHLHGVLADSNNRLYTGHFVEGGSPVLTTVEVVIQETTDVEIIRSLDEETGFALFKIYKRRQK
jgi:predicted DNA-binding protein with PD1-like motif